MINSKLIRLYTSLNKKELRLFKKWIQSPIHNRHKEVIKLFSFLETRQSISKTTVDRVRAFKHIYPNTTYDYHQLGHIMSYGCDCLISFFGFLESFLNDFETKKHQIKGLLEHNHLKIGEQLIHKTQKEQEKQSIRNDYFFLNSYQLEALFLDLNGPKQRTSSNNLPQLFDSLSNFFILATLKYACIAISHQSIYKTAYQIPFLQKVLEQAKLSSEPSIQIYYHSYMSLKMPEQETHFHQLKRLIVDHATTLPHTEIRSMYMMAINYCVRRLNTGDKDYIKTALELYKQGLLLKILLEQNVLSNFTYINIVSLALHLKDYEWTHQFIKGYSKYLTLKHKENYSNHATAKWYFAKGNYAECMQLLIQVEYDDLFLSLDAKMILLKIYYEENSFEVLDAFLHSFTVFLQRKEIMSYHKKNYLNIIRFTKKLLNTPSLDKEAKKQLQSDIEGAQPLTERQWLLDQLQQIK
ncbi:MAG: hypothetical protein GY810_29140 [Aureispira sp.]|nr:hypothetical protein [Aureispira sp.]